MAFSEKNTPLSQKEKKSKRRTLFFVGIGLLFGIITVLWWLFRQPSYGTFQIKSEEKKAVDETKIGKKRFDGKYVTFFYPADFNEKKFDEPVKDPMLERFLGSRGDIEGRKIALIVQDHTNSSLEEFSSYQIRDQAREVYTKEKVEKNGLDITIFTKNTGVFEVGAFLMENGRVASLVISSPFGLKGLQEELFSILDTFVWRDGN